MSAELEQAVATLVAEVRGLVEDVRGRPRQRTPSDIEALADAVVARAVEGLVICCDDLDHEPDHPHHRLLPCVAAAVNALPVECQREFLACVALVTRDLEDG